MVVRVVYRDREDVGVEGSDVEVGETVLVLPVIAVDGPPLVVVCPDPVVCRAAAAEVAGCEVGVVDAVVDCVKDEDVNAAVDDDVDVVAAWVRRELRLVVGGGGGGGGGGARGTAGCRRCSWCRCGRG